MNFGDAIEVVKKGGRIKRSDWKGEGSFVFLNPGSHDQSDKHGWRRIASALDQELFEKGAEGTVTRMPNLNMKKQDGSTITGWTASQVDMLAEDWETVE